MHHVQWATGFVSQGSYTGMGYTSHTNHELSLCCEWASFMHDPSPEVTCANHRVWLSHLPSQSVIASSGSVQKREASCHACFHLSCLCSLSLSPQCNSLAVAFHTRKVHMAVDVQLSQNIYMCLFNINGKWLLTRKQAYTCMCTMHFLLVWGLFKLIPNIGKSHKLKSIFPLSKK